MNSVSDTQVEAQLQKLTQDWAAAELGGDTRFLDKTLADNFVGVGPRGFMLTKTDWLQRITSGSLKYQGFAWDEVTVRAYSDSAIALGRSTQKITYQDQAMENQLRTTVVLVKQGSDWQIAGIHFSPIAPPPQGQGS